MALPDFQTLMRPMLEEYASGAERPIADVRAALADMFALTEDDLEERLHSGPTRVFDNRVGWAVYYLKATGLLTRPRRAVYCITPRGAEVLAANPQRVDLRVLAQFPEFEELRRSRKDRPPAEPITDDQVALDATPDEQIEVAHRELRRVLVEDLRARISAMPPAAFEELVLDVLQAMGYGADRESARLHLGKPGDQGIDGAIEEDRLGLDVVYVQAKRWKSDVGRPEIQAFVGALQGARAAKGIIFTAGRFSRGAGEYARTIATRVVLVDGDRLAELMIDHDVGVTTKETYTVKRPDSDYFGDGLE